MLNFLSTINARSILILPIILLVGSASAASTEENRPEALSEKPIVAEPKPLSYSEAVILGVVEGLTEYLPVSSTGHLILTDRLLDGSGGTDIALEESPEQRARNAYLIVIQGGAILAVIFIYWAKILKILNGLLGRDRDGLMFGLKVLVAFLPAAILGPLLNDLIESKLFNISAVSLALAVGAIAMILVEKIRGGKHRSVSDAVSVSVEVELSKLSFPAAAGIGFMQCLAMWPGMSRSMVTIVGGYMVGLSARAAAEFSFMLGLLTLTAASVYSLLGSWDELANHISLGPAIAGVIVATIVAFIAVKWFVTFLGKYGLFWFAIYRILLCGIILWVFMV